MSEQIRRNDTPDYRERFAEGESGRLCRGSVATSTTLIWVKEPIIPLRDPRVLSASRRDGWYVGLIVGSSGRALSAHADQALAVTLPRRP
jgi:hypothetical protein